MASADDGLLVEAIARSRDVDVDQVVLEAASFAPAVDEGKNFAGELRRVTVKYFLNGQCQEQTFVAKYPLSGHSAHWWTAMKTFEREHQFYSSLLPRLTTTLSGLQEDVPFARCYASSLERKCIVLEDLSASGFTMSDPRDFLNLEQMKLVAKRLALIHATGHDLLQRDLDFVKSSCDIIFETSELGQYLTRNEEVTTTVRSIHLGLVQVAMEMVSQELSPDERRRLKSFHETCSLTSSDARKPRTDQFLTLVHGDLWNNNIMFKRNESEPSWSDVKFVDLQVCMVTRPTYDLANLIFQSTAPDWRKQHLHFILRWYHDHLMGSLARFGIAGNVYPMDRFLADFDDFHVHGLMMGLINVQTVFTANAEVTEAYHGSSSSAEKCQTDSNEKVKTILLQLVREALAKQVI